MIKCVNHKKVTSSALINQRQSMKFHDGEVQGKKYNGKKNCRADQG